MDTTAVELVGEPARRWRRPHTEHRGGPLWGKKRPHEGAERIYTSRQSSCPAKAGAILEAVEFCSKYSWRIISTDHLRRIIAPVGGQGGVTVSFLCPHCNSFPLEDYVWWVSGRKTTKWWCTICGEKVRLEATKQAVGRANGGQF